MFSVNDATAKAVAETVVESLANTAQVTVQKNPDGTWTLTGTPTQLHKMFHEYAKD